MLRILGFIAFPVAAGAVGGILAALRPPSPGVTSATQHFAAGVVFAAVAGEILPDMTRGDHVLAVATGFGIGVAVMLGLGAWERRAEKAAEASGEVFPRVALIAVGLDLAIDGFLIGVGFIAGDRQGLLLTLALTLEVLVLSVALASMLQRAGASRARIVATTSGLSALTAVGAVGSTLLAPYLVGASLVAVLSFGCAAFLYLVTEELLVEAHENAGDESWRTAMFFVGFLAVIVMNLEGTG